MRVSDCTHPAHPRGSLGAVVRTTGKAVYRYRVCDVCGGAQGIARLSTVESNVVPLIRPGCVCAECTGTARPPMEPDGRDD